MRLRLTAALAGLALAGLAATAAAAPARTAAVPAGAAVTPASVPVFVSVSTDFGAAQLQQAEVLLRRFPGSTKLLQQVTDALVENGLDFDRDVKPALGTELNVAWLDFKNAGRNVVVLVRPQDPEKLAAVLRAINAQATKSEERVHDIVYLDGWYALGLRSRLLARFRDAARTGGRLDALPRFAGAMAALPEEALGRAFVAVGALLKTLGGDGGGGLVTAAGVPDWIAGSLAAREAGAELQLVVSSNGAAAASPQPYVPQLDALAPADVYGFATFKGGLDATALGQLGSELGTLTKMLGVGVKDIADLFHGEGAVWVRPGGPKLPEVTLVLEPRDVEASLALVDRVLARVGQRPRPASVGGVPAKSLSLGGVTITWAGVGKRIVVSNRPAAIAAVAAPSGARLADDAHYRAARAAAGLPADSGSLVYVDLARTIPYVERQLVASSRIPPDVRANLAPLRSLLLWATESGGQTATKLFVEIR